LPAAPLLTTQQSLPQLLLGKMQHVIEKSPATAHIPLVVLTRNHPHVSHLYALLSGVHLTAHSDPGLQQLQVQIDKVETRRAITGKTAIASQKWNGGRGFMVPCRAPKIFPGKLLHLVCLAWSQQYPQEKCPPALGLCIGPCFLVQCGLAARIGNTSVCVRLRNLVSRATSTNSATGLS
jgi:hypothetical protein